MTRHNLPFPARAEKQVPAALHAFQRLCAKFLPHWKVEKPRMQCHFQQPATRGTYLVFTVHCTLKLNYMLRWTLTFLVIALIAAVFGFTGIAAGAASIAKIIFYIFLVFFVISLITGAFRRSD